MDVFVSVDMEGIAGVATIRQITRGTDDYPKARELQTQEANAAVAGAFDGGATRLVVSDSHGDMGNLIPDLLDPRAELVIGTPKVPHSMMTGIGPGFACAVFVGYHAGGGTAAAVMDHTYTGYFFDVRVNGETWNETHLNAALAGAYGVPVALVAGDDKCCEQAAARLPGVRTVAVKQGIARHVAVNLSPERAREEIRRAAEEAVRAAGSLEPYRPAPPFALEVDFVSTSTTELAALAPGSERTAPRTLRFETDDFRELMRALLAWMYLARHVAPVSKVD